MLLRTLFLLLLLAVTAEAIVHGAAAIARTVLQQRANAAAQSAVIQGVRAAQTSIAQTLAVNPQASGFPVPSPIATCADADANGCRLQAQISIAAAQAPLPAIPSPCPQTNCTIVLQDNSAVRESRTAFSLAVTVGAPGGAPLATRHALAAFRTFAVPPYAALVGGADASIDALFSGGAGDVARGADAAIGVEYAPSAGGAATAGNVWRAQAEAQPLAAGAWER